MGLRIQPSQAYLGGSNSSLTINQTTACTLTSNNGINLIDRNGGINLNSTGPEINLSTNGATLSLVSGTSGDFYLRSTHGQIFTDSNGVQITPKLAVGSGGMSVIGDLNCEGTIRATANMGCTDLWCKGVFANTLQLGDKMIDGAWLNEIQKFYDKVNGGFDALRNAYNSHKHTFSVTGTAAAQSVSYSGRAVVPNGTRVGTYTLASGNSGVIYAGSNASGDISIVFGDSGISAPYSGTVTAPAQTVTLSGTSSGPTTAATNSSGPIQ